MNRNGSVVMAQVIGLVLVLGMSAASDADSRETTQPPNPNLREIIASCGSNISTPYNHAGHSCIDGLNRYFMAEPIWEVTKLNYFTPLDHNFSGLAINKRFLYLPSSPSDHIQLVDAPVWSHIFDGANHNRHDIVTQVFQDDSCRPLAKHGGIDRTLAEHCQARELFKYATYQNACLTGNRWHAILTSRATSVDENIFEYSVNEIKRLYPGESVERHEKIADLDEAYAYSMWIVNVCSNSPLAVFDDDLQSTELIELIGKQTGRKTAQIAIKLRIGHDAAMGIAARSGDEWAIQSYYPPSPRQDSYYWKTLHTTNPLLVHRWMATHIGATVLNETEQMWHTVKAYAIERETNPNLDLTDYVDQNRFRKITLDRLILDNNEHIEQDGQRPLGDVALDIIKNDSLLKYPWQQSR